MANEENDIEFIERYLEEKLNQDELINFQERLETDKDFEYLYQTYKPLIEGIKYSGKNNLLQKLKKVEASISIHESFDKKIFQIPVKSFYSYSAAATVLLLISFTFVFILNYSSSPKEIYDENFEVYPNVVMPTTRGAETNMDLKHKAYYLYDLEEYNDAVLHFEKILIKEEDPTSLLYVANSYLALGKYDSAISKLERLNKMDSEFKIQTQWFLALSYLATNQTDKAIVLLKKVKEKKVSYSKKADSILKSLK